MAVNANADSVIYFEIVDLRSDQLQELFDIDGFLGGNNRDENVDPEKAMHSLKRKKISTISSTKRDIQNVQRWLWQYGTTREIQGPFNIFLPD